MRIIGGSALGGGAAPASSLGKKLWPGRQMAGPPRDRGNPRTWGGGPLISMCHWNFRCNSRPWSSASLPDSTSLHSFAERRPLTTARALPERPSESTPLLDTRGQSSTLNQLVPRNPSSAQRLRKFNLRSYVRGLRTSRDVMML